MKKIISIMITMVMLLSLCACSQTAPEIKTADEPAADPAPAQTADTAGLEEQESLIKSFIGTWTPEDDLWPEWFYTITDLDHNGRLEVIFASLQGTGLFTYSEAYEISEDFRFLNRITSNTEEGFSEPDIICDRAPCYFDASTGLYHYIFEDALRNGMYSHGNAVISLTLDNGALNYRTLASWYEEFDEGGTSSVEEYFDENGNPGSWEQYESAADTAYSGLEKTEATFTWNLIDNGQDAQPAQDQTVVYAADLFEGSGFARSECTVTGVYDFAPVNSEGVTWEVYILDAPFTDAERYIPQAFSSALQGSGRLSIRQGQWIYVYCPCNAWTMETAPEGCAFSWRLDPDAEYSEPVETHSGPAVVITKSPMGESIPAGGKNWFIAHADNADRLTWQFLDTNGAVHSVDETMAMNPGLGLQVLEGDTIAVTNVPSSFNGWSVQALFEGPGGSAATDAAPIFVGDYLSTYSRVINNYKNYASSGAGTVTYTSLDEVFSGNFSADVSGVGFLATSAKNLGYLLNDLNGDGVPELIIGASDNEYYDEIIIDMFTISGGQVKRVLASSDRCRYALRSDKLISVSGSSGASDSADYLLRFAGSGITVENGAAIYGEGTSLFYYRVTDTDFDHSNDTQISESEYYAAVDAIHQNENKYAMKVIG